MESILPPLVLLLIALAAFQLARWLRLRSGLPAGELVGEDTGAGQPWTRPLRNARIGLAGKPDYVVRRGKEYIPIEVKSGAAPPHPHASHLIQLYAYCHLLETVVGVQVRRAILRYSDRSFPIDWNEAARQTLLGSLAALREQEAAGEALRSHQIAGRCRACGYASICPQRLPGVRSRE